MNKVGLGDKRSGEVDSLHHAPGGYDPQQDVQFAQIRFPNLVERTGQLFRRSRSDLHALKHQLVSCTVTLLQNRPLWGTVLFLLLCSIIEEYLYHLYNAQLITTSLHRL